MAGLAGQIRQQVLEMEDGAFLGSQDELLARYGVNVPTLRQAMVALMNEQLVVSRRGVGGGFFVRRPDVGVVSHSVALYLRSRGVAIAEQVATLLPVRMEIARRAARSRDEAARAELAEFLEAERQAPLDISFVEFNEAEKNFNRVLAKLSGSATLTMFLEILLDLARMIHKESDVFGTLNETGSKMVARRRIYREARSRMGRAVLDRDPRAAALCARECFHLTWRWLGESRPDLMLPATDPEGALGFGPLAVSAPGDEADATPAVAEHAADEGPVAELRRVDEERRKLEARRAALAESAAVELGQQVIEAGGINLDARQLRAVIDRVVALGPGEALHRLLSV